MSDDTNIASSDNTKESPSKQRRGRGSNIARATSESQALLKQMGMDKLEETPGRRRTRAATRGGRRGRPKKDESLETSLEEQNTDSTPAEEVLEKMDIDKPEKKENLEKPSQDKDQMEESPKAEKEEVKEVEEKVKEDVPPISEPEKPLSEDKNDVVEVSPVVEKESLSSSEGDSEHEDDAADIIEDKANTDSVQVNEKHTENADYFVDQNDISITKTQNGGVSADPESPVSSLSDTTDGKANVESSHTTEFTQDNVPVIASKPVPIMSGGTPLKQQSSVLEMSGTLAD